MFTGGIQMTRATMCGGSAAEPKITHLVVSCDGVALVRTTTHSAVPFALSTHTRMRMRAALVAHVSHTTQEPMPCLDVRARKPCERATRFGAADEHTCVHAMHKRTMNSRTVLSLAPWWARMPLIA